MPTLSSPGPIFFHEDDRKKYYRRSLRAWRLGASSFAILSRKFDKLCKSGNARISIRIVFRLKKLETLWKLGAISFVEGQSYIKFFQTKG